MPAECTFGESDWAALEGIIDEEQPSSDECPSTNLLENMLSRTPSIQESCILDSSENTPLPSPLQDFDDPEQNQIHNCEIGVTNSCSPSEQLQTEPEKLVDNDVLLKSVDNLSTHEIQITPINSPVPIASVESLVTISECDSPSTSNNLNKKRKLTFKTNPGKKRKRCEEKWIDNIRKKLLNSGQKYITRKGKLKDEKKMRPVCLQTCKLKCYEKFDTETRQNILTQFWKLSDNVK